jgi:hypothetical protein
MFFHILLWNLYPDADAADVAEGMRRMQHENPDDLKRLTFGRRADVPPVGPLPFGELRRGPGGLVAEGEGFEHFFLTDFEDNPAYRRYVDSDAHMDFVWETCAARWSRFMSINQVHEEAAPTAAATSGGAGSLLDLVQWDCDPAMTELEAAEMLSAAVALRDAAPGVAGLMAGRGSLTDPGSGEKVVDRSLLRPRQEPRPYHLVGEPPRFGMALEFADGAAFGSFAESEVWAGFVDRYSPSWTRAWHLPMTVEWG